MALIRFGKMRASPHHCKVSVFKGDNAGFHLTFTSQQDPKKQVILTLESTEDVAAVIGPMLGQISMKDVEEQSEKLGPLLTFSKMIATLLGFQKPKE